MNDSKLEREAHLTQKVLENSQNLHRETENELQSYIILQFIQWYSNIKDHTTL